MKSLKCIKLYFLHIFLLQKLDFILDLKNKQKKQLKPTKINLRPCFAAKPLEAYNRYNSNLEELQFKNKRKKYKESICNYIFKITHSNYVQTKQKQQICMPIY